jgi:glycosyltransferase involved in cell wall biosynthesis
MPCHNAVATIDEAVESILAQTLEQLELVVVDDGSTDETLNCLQAWEQRDSRVRVLSLPHAGIIQALNAGLRLCRAPLIARMDADDRSHLERLNRQVDMLQSRPELAAVGCLVEGFPKQSVREGFRIYLDWLNSLQSPEAISREIFIESPLAHPSVTMRREWLERVGGYQDHGWPEDYDLWLRMHAAGAHFAKVPDVLLYWREHPDRLTRIDSRYSVENFLRAKAKYLCTGPLADRDAVLIWGAGQMGRRLSKHLQRGGAALAAFIDIDPGKIGRMKRGLPIVAAEDALTWWERYKNPMVLAAVGSRGARALIREHLTGLGLIEGPDFLAVA